MASNLRAAIVKRAEELKLPIDVPEFADGLAAMIEVFYLNVQKHGKQYGLKLTVTSNLQIEPPRKRKTRRR